MAKRTSWAPLAIGGGLAVAALLGLGALGIGLAMAGDGMTAEASAIVAAYGVRPSLAIRVVDLARAIGTHPYWLADLIEFESEGSWKSSKRNPASKAVGLIQITPYSAGLLMNMDGTQAANLLAQLPEEEYLDWAQLYFERVLSGNWPDDPRPVPVNTLQALAMSVYHPPARKSPLDSPYPPVPSGPNKGWKPTGTPGDYLRRMLTYGGKLTPLVQGGTS